MQTDIANKLCEFWQNRVNAKIINSYDAPGAAATFHPECFFGVLGKTMDPIIYLQPSRRYNDRNLGNSLVRFAKHVQCQLMIPYYPEVIQDYYDSLKYIGWNPTQQTIQFIQNNWKHDSLCARGIGWEVLCDQMEITQFTFFEYMGNQKLDFTPVEIAYGIERLEICFSKQKLYYHQGLTLREEIETNGLTQIQDLYNITDFNNSTKQINKLLMNNLVIYAYITLLQQNTLLNILIMSIDHNEKTILLQQIANNSVNIARCYRSLINKN